VLESVLLRLLPSALLAPVELVDPLVEPMVDELL